MKKLNEAEKELRERYEKEMSERSSILSRKVFVLEKAATQLLNEKDLFPPISNNPLHTLINDNFGRKLYKFYGTLCNISSEGVLFKEKLYLRIN